MQMSRYFKPMVETYITDMRDLLADCEGNEFQDRIIAKQREFDALLPMMAEFPEMVAPAFHRGLRFREAKTAEMMLMSSGNDFPSWAKLKPLLDIAGWALPMIKKVLAQEGGGTFLAIAATLDFAFLDAEDAPAYEAPPDVSDDDDVEDLGSAGNGWLEEQGFDRRPENS